jgi:peptide/nickel transport system permease protein
MRRTILTKLALVIPELLLVSLATFLLVYLVPGDPAQHVLGTHSTPADYAQIRAEMGLDRPMPLRFIEWLGGALHGDLGNNLVPPIEKVSTRLLDALPVNLELAVLALLMALTVAVPLAMLSARRPGSATDRMVSAGAFAALSVPSFLMGVILLLVLAVNWHVFPLGQWARPSEQGWPANLSHAFLPALTLALVEAPAFSQVLRSDLISTLHEDFILAARAKGMPERHILLREALRPSSFSLITLAGVSVGRLIGGTIIVEGVFGLPGMGHAVVNAAQESDYPLVQGGVLLIASVYIAINLLVDVLYAYLDPRIRRGTT